MSMSKREKGSHKSGRSVLARCVVICIVAAFIGSSGIFGLAVASQAEDRVKVTVNAPAYVEETFNVTIDVANITCFNSGQFDLSFDASVVNVTEVRDGELNGEAVPIFLWNSVDADTVRVLVSMPMEIGVNGSGYLAEVEFEVRGISGAKSKLDISNGLLVDTEAKGIDADWYDDEVAVSQTEVTVDALESVSGTFYATIRIDNVTDLNSAQFDLTFSSSVVNVTDVKSGEINGEAVPIFQWRLNPNKDIVRVLAVMPIGESVSGGGYVAEIEFTVTGKEGEKSKLTVSNEELVDATGKIVPSIWHGAEVTIGVES